MFVIRNSRTFLSIAAILMVTAVVAIVVWGFNFSIDFTGGSILEVRYTGERPDASFLRSRLNQFPVSGFVLQPSGESGYIVRTEVLSDQEKDSLINLMSFEGERGLVEERFSNIGPVIGEELKTRSIWAILIVVVAIILFVAFSFRKVSRSARPDDPVGRVSSWKYGLVAVFALIHDILIPTGVFVVLGAFLGIQIDILFITALLAILGFSVNDTIVVFDRIRENLSENEDHNIKEEFDLTVGKSLEETYGRSLNTSLTTTLVLLSLLFLGGETTTFFALALLLGMIAGTYSSIFVASPLLVAWQSRETD